MTQGGVPVQHGDHSAWACGPTSSFLYAYRSRMPVSGLWVENRAAPDGGPIGIMLLNGGYACVRLTFPPFFAQALALTM